MHKRREKKDSELKTKEKKAIEIIFLILWHLQKSTKKEKEKTKDTIT